MGTAAAVEGIAGRGVPLPQCVIGLSVQPGDGPPLVEDGVHPVAGRLPLGGVGGQVLGLGGQRLFAGTLRRSVLVAARPLGLSGFVGLLGDGGKPRRQGIDVTQNAGGGQGVGQRVGGGLDLAGVTGAGGQPGFHQRDLSGEVVEAAAEVVERGLGVAGLPRTDHAFPGRGHQIHAAVLGDPAELPGVVVQQRRPGGRMGRGTARAGPGRGGPGRGTGRGASPPCASSPFMSHLPSARFLRAPAARSGSDSSWHTARRQPRGLLNQFPGVRASGLVGCGLPWPRRCGHAGGEGGQDQKRTGPWGEDRDESCLVPMWPPCWHWRPPSSSRSAMSSTSGPPKR